jgi:hypothetical protein
MTLQVHPTGIPADRPDPERPTDPRPAWERVAYAWLAREVDAGQPIDSMKLAREVSVAPDLARDLLRVLRAHRQRDPELSELRTRLVRDRITDAYLRRELRGDQRQISQQLAELRAGPATVGERIAQLWQHQQQDPTGRPLHSSRLAWRLGVSDSYVRHRTWQLRTRAGQAPLGERLAATRQQLASPPPPVEHVDGERDWRLDAACRDVDPELFFPETGQVPQVTQAKQVCAGCAVRGPCLQAALHGPQARDDHSGIFAGTTARQRVALRGRASMAEGTRFIHDRAAAEAALALANRVSIDRAARELSVSKQALRRAFDHHGLPQPVVFQGGPHRTRFYDDRQAAEQAWRRAAEVGINQTRKELGVSDRALRTAWRRHGLGLPPRPTSTSTPATRRLDGAFVALNRKLLPARARSEQELAARVRRGEEYAALGAEVVVEMGSETYGKRPAARVWAITRRAQRAHRRAVDRQGRTERRRADRASRTDRTSRARAPVEERQVTADAR